MLLLAPMAIIDSSNRLLTVHWELRERFEKMAKLLKRETGWDIRVRSGRRSCAEQNALYAQGRSNAGSVVTNAPGCRSWHVVGRAIDADPIDPSTGAPPRKCAPYQIAGAIWESLGGKWGGRFSGFGPCGDAGHFQWHPGMKMSEVCPDPQACNDAEYLIASVKPPPPMWKYMAYGAGAVVAIALVRRAL